MNTQKLTYAGMLSAVIVAMTLFVMMTGLGYTIFIDLGLPVLIGLVYLKCGFKYTSLCGIISVLIIFFGMGDLPTAIWMIQGIIIGLICSVALSKDSTIMDDLLWCSVGGAFIVIFIDVYCENILGMSLITELWRTLEPIPAPDVVKEIAVSIGLASLPVGTSIIAYIGTLFVGHKLRILSGTTKEKFKVIKGFKKYAGYLCCSKGTTYRWILYLVGIQALQFVALPLYLKTVLGAIQWIALYFILRDAHSLVSKFIYTKTGSIGITKGIGLGIFLMLFSLFKITIIVLTSAGCIVDLIYHVRDRQIQMLKQQVA
ncbi:hypothetical protein [Niameybacter massiliensis]|uniref:hypothetical protein n=1 Tax=Niameybacter massiliensis TaxID=1658108 RepID=UPI0006B6271F|nr:hypothetical protein [Niameybacter massiliensis]